MLVLLLVLSGCKAAEGEPCLKGSDCRAELACVNDKCASCAKSDRCKLYGLCAVVQGRCEVPAVSDADCSKPHGEKSYTPCIQDGKCTASAGACSATSDEACAKSNLCKQSAACSAKDGQCIIASSDDCKKADVCAQLAHCTLRDGACALTSDDDCKAAMACKSAGLCTLFDNRCTAQINADCKESYMCKSHGACRAEKGKCVP